jgi:hypothetical protein
MLAKVGVEGSNPFARSNITMILAGDAWVLAQVFLQDVDRTCFGLPITVGR